MRFREGVAREELALELSDAACATLLAALELHDKKALEVQSDYGAACIRLVEIENNLAQ